ncbi:MCE family protein [Nocardia sp. CA2R105]|uniref:MCE family protein n=1 Tax=Nocardia coffeae TaxID=2873381 RepID=UPI001CA62FE9|nr:MCE family protein [Nocardia coffeae]MBY8856588.1 MCE family protein [Nocardia coffeae]
MSIAFESDGKMLSNTRLFVRGVGVLAVIAIALAAVVAKFEGAFEHSVRVTAELVDVGDGLPPMADVKYRGVLVGRVGSVSAPVGGGSNIVRIDLDPGYVSAIPDTVTARVVPSNAFAVPSVQLVYNGPGAPLSAGAHIGQDRSSATVQLQTSLTALARIAGAAGRSGSDPALGILAVVERATSGEGAAALQAGANLSRIAGVLNSQMAPGGTGSTLDALSRALTGLRASSPDLLGAVHNAIGPMQVLAERKDQLRALLTGGLTTSSTVATALDNNTAKITGITANISPALAVIADGSSHFTQMELSLQRLVPPFAGAWDPKTQNLTAKAIIELTPHRQYTRADCPRYGALAGPSCATAPAGAVKIIGPQAGAPLEDLSLIGGNVGQVGSSQEQQKIAALLGGVPNPAADLLFGPLLRGSDATVVPAPGAPVPAAPAGPTAKEGPR